MNIGHRAPEEPALDREPRHQMLDIQQAPCRDFGRIGFDARSRAFISRIGSGAVLPVISPSFGTAASNDLV